MAESTDGTADSAETSVRPTLDELTRHVDVGIAWRQLGIPLKLEGKCLGAIDVENRLVADKLSAMFQSWLDRNPDATRRDVLEALTVINMNTHADNYRRAIVTVDRQGHTHSVKQPSFASMEVTTQASIPAEEIVRPPSASIKGVDHDRFINKLKDMVHNDRDLAAIAHKLKKKFEALEVKVKNCLSSMHLFNDAKRLIRRNLSDGFACAQDQMEMFRNDLDNITDAEELFNFLDDKNFLTYLNYQLLEKISERLTDKDIHDSFEKYKAKYTTLLKCASFDGIIAVFRNFPNLKPAAIIGFPLLKLRLERPELYHSMYDCCQEFSVPLAGIEENCVVITFSVFPSALLDLLKYLNDPVNVRRFESKEVSVILELYGPVNESCQVFISKIDHASSIIKIQRFTTHDIECAPNPSTKAFQERFPRMTHPVKTKKGTCNMNIAAIDFGTTYCSLAFSLKEDNTGSRDVECVPLNPHHDRVPTALLLKKEGDNSIAIVAIGFVAQELYDSLPSSQRAKHLYFECFKNQLRGEKEISREEEILTLAQEEYYLIEVISLVLQHLKAILETTSCRLKATDFNWVITVPAQWNNSGKQMMREAAYRAGLLSADVPPITTLTPVGQPLVEPDMRHCAHKLTLALEPECAALYCQQLTNDMLAGYSDPVTGLASKCYMVLDIGGGTADIAVHKVEDNNTISSVIQPTENEWGGMKVNIGFSEFLQNIVGDPKFEQFFTGTNHKTHYEPIISKLVYRDFELGKKHFSDYRFSVNIALNDKLFKFYEDRIKAGIGVQFEDNVMSIDCSKMEELFSSTVKGIIECVTDALNNSPVSSIDTAYLVGGFGGCHYLYTKLKEALVKECPGICVIVPRDHKLAVVKGAVIYRENPGIVGSRISDAYYGIETTDPELDCHNVFDILIEKSQVVNFNDVFTKSYRPLSASQEVVSFPIYRTENDDVQHTRDSKGNPIPGVDLIGTVTIETSAFDGPREECEIKCTFHLGGTELKVTTIYGPTGESVYAALDFLAVKTLTT